MNVACTEDEEPPTCRFERATPAYPRDATDALTARGVARLAALADWLDGEEPSGVVVSLVRAFLRDVSDVGVAVEALVAAASETQPELCAAVRSLALAIGLWRSSLVEHVDDLALGSYRSFAGWASLPEYSSAYALAIVQPALAEAEAWAMTRRASDKSEIGHDVAAQVRAIGSHVRRLNKTLRSAISPSADADASGSAPALDARLLAAAW